MKDLFLKFDNQEHMMQVFTSLNMVIESLSGEPCITQANHDYSVYEVGDIPGKSGWHVNMRILNLDWDYSVVVPYQVHPMQPYCVWA